MSLIEINISNLTKKYKRNYVFKNYNNKINNKYINILWGVNGRGKTTLVKCIIGFIKYRGNINFKYTFSYMPERINYPKYVKLKTFLNLLCLINKHNKRNTISYYINLFNLKQHINKNINELSLGTLKKISLIKTLIEDTDVYIFDEPLNGLDRISINIFKDELCKLKESNKLVIIITHNIEVLNLTSYNIIDLNYENK